MLLAAQLPLLLAATIAGAPPSDPLPIYGGQAAQVCQWPQAAGLYNGGSSQLCSAALIHPQIVAYAAHCGTAFTTLRLGEDVTAPARKVAVASCHAHPEVDGTPARDFAYCRLAEPVLDLPVVPPLVGCETAALAEGEALTLVGFGEIEGGSAGIKHWVEVAIDTYPFMESLILAGGDGLGTCKWDSGAPGYVRLADGSWRTAGVTYGTTLACGAGTVLIPLFGFVAWLEEHSGIDVTPCHEGDAWDPGGRCDRLAVDPDVGGGAWVSACDAGVSGPGASCGDPYSAAADDDPPTVTIAAPADGTSYPGPAAAVAVSIVADDGAGWGVDQVTLAVDGALGPALSLPPYMYTIDLPEGTWSLVAGARDFAGHEASSPPVVITVGTPSAGTTGGTGADSTGAATGDPGESSETTPGDSDVGSPTDAGSEATSAGAEPTISGCGCASGGSGGALVFALLPALRRRFRGKSSGS